MGTDTTSNTTNTAIKKEKKAPRKVTSYDKEGQRKPTPHDMEGAFIFYHSLYAENPNSEMAEIWLMEHGCFDAAKQKILAKKYQKIKPKKVASKKKKTVKKKKVNKSKKKKSKKKNSKKKSTKKKKTKSKKKKKTKKKPKKKRKAMDISEDSDSSDEEMPIVPKKINNDSSDDDVPIVAAQESSS